VVTPFPRVDLPVFVLVTPDLVWFPLAESEAAPVPAILLFLLWPVMPDELPLLWPADPLELMPDPVVSMPDLELAAPGVVDEPVAPDVVAESDLTGAVSPTPPPPPVDMLVSLIVPLAPFCIEPDSIPLPVVPALLLSPLLPLHAVIPARYSEPTIHGVHFIRAPLLYVAQRVPNRRDTLAPGAAP
jgi:hypothetical protein